MITASYKMTVAAGKKEELLEVIRMILGPIRVENGCLSARIYQDILDENTFVLLEEWESQADVGRHIRGDNFRKLLLMMDTLSGVPEVSFHPGDRPEGLQAIEEILGMEVTSSG